ncbi:MAG: valine--tRNA ligase [Alphaproteobacteria bacterium]
MTKKLLETVYNPAAIEKKIYKAWTDDKCFQLTSDADNTFTITMPPANVTGNLHLGHALTFTLQDVLIRFERMRGKDVLWQAGTDHAGIATQMVVERQLEEKGIKRQDLGKEAFLEKIWEWKNHSGGAIVKQLQRLGASADWSRERFTMDKHASACVTKAFVDLYRDNLIYKDKKLVNWDTKYQTAISDLEVEQKELKGKLYYIKYPCQGKEGHIVVATTRPETCFADTAVAVNPKDERYKSWVGETVLIPISNRPIKVIADSYCDPEKGTGAVKITPAHDFNDFEVGKRHHLESIELLDEYGLLNKNAPEEYRGLNCQAAREKLVDALKELELLEKEENIIHTVPFGDRSGVVIEPRLTDQWYVNAHKLAVPALEAVRKGHTKFFPENWTKVYFDWLENIQPWCISRQLWWGHPIPAWYGPDGKIFVAENFEEALSLAKTHYGKQVDLVQDPDVLDTWFSSGLWPFVTLGWPEDNPVFNRHYPTDVLVTGFDIIFFWVARMMMMGLYFTEKVPFKTVYIHALIRDAKGQKMSKSKGNVIDPLHLIDQYGADALRFTLGSMAVPGRDVRMSEEKVAANRNFVTKIWNAVRYAQMNDCFLDAPYVPSACAHPVNQWIVTEVNKLIEETTEHLETYTFHEMAQGLYHFLWGTFCDWYVEFTKPILNGDDAKAKKETKHTLAWVLGQFGHLMHPLMPFITEEVWEALEGEGLLIKASWPTPVKAKFGSAEKDVLFVIDFISSLRSMRAELGISPAYLLEVYWAEGPKNQQEVILENKDLIERLGRLKEIHFTPAETTKKIQLIVQKTTCDVLMEGVIDVSAEFRRLQKEMEKINQEKNGIKVRLANPEFRQKAPEAIIDELNNRLENLDSLYSKTLSAFEKIKSLS